MSAVIRGTHLDFRLPGSELLVACVHVGCARDGGVGHDRDCCGALPDLLCPGICMIIHMSTGQLKEATCVSLWLHLPEFCMSLWSFARHAAGASLPLRSQCNCAESQLCSCTSLPPACHSCMACKEATECCQVCFSLSCLTACLLDAVRLRCQDCTIEVQTRPLLLAVAKPGRMAAVAGRIEAQVRASSLRDKASACCSPTEHGTHRTITT